MDARAPFFYSIAFVVGEKMQLQFTESSDFPIRLQFLFPLWEYSCTNRTRCKKRIQLSQQDFFLCDFFLSTCYKKVGAAKLSYIRHIVNFIIGICLNTVKSVKVQLWNDIMHVIWPTHTHILWWGYRIFGFNRDGRREIFISSISLFPLPPPSPPSSAIVTDLFPRDTWHSWIYSAFVLKYDLVVPVVKA